jgi:O-antigen/teichoic acid export membrane protein
MIAVSAGVVRWRFGPFPLPTDRATLMRVAMVCWPFLLLDALQIVQFKVDTVMIFALVSSEAAARYETAYRLLEVSRLLVRPLAMVTFPLCVAMAARGDLAGIARMGRKLVLVAGAAGVALAVVGGVTAELLMVTIWGDAYRGTGGLLRVLFLTVPFLYVSLIGSVLATAVHLEHRLTHVMAAATVLNVVLNGAVIPHWGATGAACTTLATEMFIVLSLAWLMRKTLGPEATQARRLGTPPEASFAPVPDEVHPRGNAVAD